MSDVFFVVASIGFIATAILAGIILVYVILLVRSLKRVVDALEAGVDIMKRDVESIHKHLTDHSGVMGKILSTLIDLGFERFAHKPKKKTAKKRAAKKKIAKK